MIEWRDEGAVLSVRQHGETSAIVEVFTAVHGRHAGVVRGGVSRRLAPLLQPGAQIEVVWKARLDEHLGSFTVEPLRSRAAMVMADRLALAGLNAVVALLGMVLPEREAHPGIYARSVALLDLLDRTDLWPLAYLHWEVALLDEMGFALDLTRCAVTGATEGLVYVSPRSGRAVSAAGAGEWADRLLPLPPVLRGAGVASDAEISRALSTTGHFIEHRLVRGAGDRPLPAARQRLLDALARRDA
jgi:DNA repair protein RecO (recombination protein O)